MNFGAIIIGDEILSGKRVDMHFDKIVSLLAARGLRLSWAEYLGDERSRIAATLKRTFASGDVVFSFGGIGNTPDDHTRQAAAEALGVDLVLHPEAEREMRTRFGDDMNDVRLLLATFLSGLMLALAGYLRLGKYIKFIPYPVTVGFTAGIAVIIFASQIGELFGLKLDGREPGPILDKIAALWAARPSFKPKTLPAKVAG